MRFKNASKIISSLVLSATLGFAGLQSAMADEPAYLSFAKALPGLTVPGKSLLAPGTSNKITQESRTVQLEKLAEVFAVAFQQDQSCVLSGEQLAVIQGVRFSLNELSSTHGVISQSLSPMEKAFVLKRAGELSRGKVNLSETPFSFAFVYNVIQHLGDLWAGTPANFQTKTGAVFTFSDDVKVEQQEAELEAALVKNKGEIIALVSNEGRRDDLEKKLKGTLYPTYQDDLIRVRFFSERDAYVPSQNFNLASILSFVASRLSKAEVGNITFATPDGDFQANWVSNLILLKTLAAQGYHIRLEPRSSLLGGLPAVSIDIESIFKALEVMSENA